jgi:hypothetical protein
MKDADSMVAAMPEVLGSESLIGLSLAKETGEA